MIKKQVLVDKQQGSIRLYASENPCAKCPSGCTSAAPAPAAANGGAFGAKRGSALPATARALADEHGRPVVALWSREDVARHGFKRPPVALRREIPCHFAMQAADLTPLFQ